MSGKRTWVSGEAWRVSTAFNNQGLRLGVILAVAGLFCAVVGVPVHADLVCPPRLSATPGLDFHDQTLIHRNFAYQDLENADFSGTSALSPLNVRGEGLECGACVVDCEWPIAPARRRVTGR